MTQVAKVGRSTLVRGTVGIILALTMAVLLSPPNASADLLYDHFGVTLEIDSNIDNRRWDTYQDAWSYRIDPDSYTPTQNAGTIDYEVDDWFGAWDANGSVGNSNSFDINEGTEPAGGEPYDVEAIYFDDDADNLYIAIVTSFDPSPGIYESRMDDVLIVTGDLALDFGFNDPHSPDNFSYDYGVNLNYENRQTSGNATSGGTTIGNELYRTANSDWYLGTPNGAVPSNGELTNFDPDWASFSGSYLGETTTTYYTYDFGSSEETLYDTYIIEVTIPRSLLPALYVGDQIGVTWVEGCRNDAANMVVDADIDQPEPATLVLTSLGLCALGWLKRRRAGAEDI